MVDNSVYSGKSNSILVGYESAWGSAVACSKDLGIINDGSIESSEEQAIVRGIGDRNAQAIVRTRFRVKGSLDIVYQHARLLFLTLGSATHSGVSDPYTHTVSEANTVPPFTLQAARNMTSSGRITKVNGAKIGSLKIACEKGGVLKCSVDWIGKQPVITTTTAVQTYDAVVPATPAQMGVYIGADLADPSTILPLVQAYECTINNNLESVDAIYDVLIGDLVENDREYTGKVSFPASQATVAVQTMASMLGTTASTQPETAQTASALKLVWASGTTPARGLILTLYGVKFGSLTEPYTRNGVVYVDMPFTAKSLGACTGTDDVSGAAF